MITQPPNNHNAQSSPQTPQTGVQHPHSTQGNPAAHTPAPAGERGESKLIYNLKTAGIFLVVLAFLGGIYWYNKQEDGTALEAGTCLTELKRVSADGADEYVTDCDSPDAKFVILTASTDDNPEECIDVTGSVSSLTSTLVSGDESKKAHYCLGNADPQPEDKINTVKEGECMAFTKSKEGKEVAVPADCGKKDSMEVVKVIDNDAPESATGLPSFDFQTGEPKPDPFCKEHGAPEATSYYHLSFGMLSTQSDASRTWCVK